MTTQTVQYPDILKRVIAGRTALLLDEPFFGQPAMLLRLREDLTCKTAWVDGQTFGYNPHYIAKLNHAELKAIWAHEVLHCANGHPWRRGGRDHRRFNEACDRAINPMLRDCKDSNNQAIFTLPPKVMYELEPSHLGKSAEWIYDRLPTPPSGAGSGNDQDDNEGEDEDEGDDNVEGQDEGSKGDVEGQGKGSKDTPSKQPRPGATGPQDSPKAGTPEPNDPPSPGDDPDPLGEVRDAPSGESGEDDMAPPTESEWKEAIMQAAALGQGSVPGAMKRLVEQVKKPQVDWKSVLRRFVQQVARGDYTFRRPAARYVPHGLYMPSLHSDEVGPIVIGVDTSGSIDAVLLAQFAAEMQSIVDEVHPTKVVVMYCDAQVHRTDEFTQDEMITLNPCGGGGTDFRPVFAEVETMDEPPVCIVYLTDLWGTFPDKAPDVPTLWVTGMETTRTVPFGELVSAS